MSSSNRTTSKGGKGAKADKSQKSEGKGSGDKKHFDSGSKNEDPGIKEKVKTLLEATQRSEEEVCLALHECDFDVNLAIEMLFESMGTGEWETRVKKKKNRQASASKQDKAAEDGGGGATTLGDDWNDGDQLGASKGPAGGDRERPGRGGKRGDRDGNNANGPARNRGWRGRERQENERNAEDGGGGRGERRGGRGGGASRGGRGRGGGRAGGGGRYPPRGGNRSGGGYGGRQQQQQTIDTWENTWESSNAATTNHNDDKWGDDFPGADEWSTEEYTGSLTETKVFTPSVQQPLDNIADPNAVQVGLDQTLASGQQMALGQQQVQMPSQSPVPPMVGTLTAAQSQYFSQLSQQNNDGLNQQQFGAQQTFQNQTYEKSATPQGFNNASQSYNASQQYPNAVTNTYNSNSYQSVNSGFGTSPQDQPSSQQPTRAKTQRARVPPPSKIPSSAVEMPGELNNIGYLDVQFGAMDLIDNNSFDNMSEKYAGSNTSNLENSLATQANSLDLSSATNQNSSLDAYSTKPTIQSSISSALSQSLSSTDNIPQTSEHITASYNSAARSTSQSSAGTAPSSGVTPGLDTLKQDSYSQATTYSSYPSKANNYSSSYSTAQTTASSYVANQPNSYQSASYTPSGTSYPNYSSTTSSYQSNSNSATFPSITQASSYPSSNQNYPQNTSQSVYGANSGLNSSSNFGNTTTSQYNSYNATNKLGKDSSYDNSSNSVSSGQSTTTTNVTSATASISLSQTTISSSKTTTTLAKNTSVVSNIPPGVAPVMSTPYIMGQVPYFQPSVYSYEEMQMLQRLPHAMTTPYYDMSYQTTPTTLAAVRGDAAAAALNNVAAAAAAGYSISSDGRFARADNNASPVPSSTLSQPPSSTLAQQGQAAQPILAAGTAPPFFYAATPFNTIPNYAQFGTMYTQLPAATNAHGSSNSSQYPKPGTYGSGYGSYDALGQTAAAAAAQQDYAKSGYVATAAAVAAQAQKGAAGSATTGGSAANDLTAMYGKSHTALGKVNSYEKQGFHSGTPPPFQGALHGSQGAGLAPSGTGYAPPVYIPTMAPQHHSTQLMHQPLHQDSSNTSGQRSQASNQGKSGGKQPYQASYWNQN